MGDEKEIICPLCGECLISSRSKGLHAQKHNLTPEKFHELVLGGRPTCQCCETCVATTAWKSWKYGFNRYARGHVSEETKQKLSVKTTQYLEKFHWAKGKTKYSDERIKLAAIKKSDTLKEKYKTGAIKQWNSGYTKDTHPSLKSSADKRRGKKSSSHWKFLNADVLQKRLDVALGDNFEITSLCVDDRRAIADTDIELLCLRCERIINTSVYNVIRNNDYRCMQCDRTYFSKNEEEILQAISTFYTGKIYKNDRSNPTGFELDLFLPDENLAIEHNGLYWHSTAIQPEKMYHQLKTSACKKHGIRLIHVFEDEWRDKREIILSMIRHRLKKDVHNIGARKCVIRELTREESRSFFNDNHIDGAVRGEKTWGLIYKDTIVSALQVRKPFSKKWLGFYEVARFANKLNHHIPGSFSKLFKFVKSQINLPIMTYVDTRWGSNGQHCVKQGMSFSHATTPTFWWTDRVRRMNRLACKADEWNTQVENAKKRELFQIFGCECLVFKT